MVCNNLIVGSHALHNVTKATVNILNDISTFVDPNTPTNIITNDTILNQYIIKQGLNVFGKKGEATVKKICRSFMTEQFVDQKKYQYLRCEQQRNILAYIIILKIKNDDVITKVRGCTYGRN